MEEISLKGIFLAGLLLLACTFLEEDHQEVQQEKEDPTANYILFIDQEENDPFII